MRHCALLMVVTFVMIFLYGGIDYTVEPYSGWGLSSYRAMAASSPGIAKDVGRPFAYRLWGPYVAGLFPIPDPVAFRAIAIIASVFLVLVFYLFLRRAGLTSHISLTIAALLTFNKYWFGFTAWDYFQVNDVLLLCVVVVMAWSMVEERWIIFGSALALGALTKEASMLMVPVLFVYLFEKKAPRNSWWKALLSTLPGLAVFVAVRMLVPAAKGSGLLEAFLAYSGKVRSPERLFRLSVNSFGPLSLIPLVAPGATIRFFKERKYALLLVGLIFVSALFGSNDERLMAPCFVVVYLLIGVILQDSGLNKWSLAVLVAVGFVSSFHHIFARYPLPGREFTVGVSLGSVLIVTCVTLYYRLARPGRRKGECGGGGSHPLGAQ